MGDGCEGTEEVGVLRKVCIVLVDGRCRDEIWIFDLEEVCRDEIRIFDLAETWIRD